MTHPLFRKEVFVDYVDTYQGQNAFSSFNEVRKDGNQHRCTSGGDSASARGLFHSKALWFKKCLHNIETAFAKRFQKMLQDAWDNRSWHLIVADPGAGKTMSIRDLQKRAGGRSVLAVVAPKNNDDEQALGDQLYTALGLPLRGHWSTRKPKLMGHLHQYGTQCLIVDDAHDLSLEHLMLIKEVTDQGHLQYGHPLGLCLVAAWASRGLRVPARNALLADMVPASVYGRAYGF